MRAQVGSDVIQLPHDQDHVPEQVTGQLEAHDEAHEPMTEIELKILGACAQSPKSTSDLLKSLGYKVRTGNFKRALSRLLDRYFLEMTNPQKPRSKNQKYRITPLGEKLLK